MPIGTLYRRPPSTHRRIYKPGRKIRTMSALDKWLNAGGYVFWGTRRNAIHPGWFMSMQYRILSESVRTGFVRKAVRI